MNSLVVFARAPVAGQTKTRLAQGICRETGGKMHAEGAAAIAATIAAAMLRDTLETARNWGRSGGEASVAFAPADAFGAGAGSLDGFWDGPRFAQSSGDIGMRMLAALRHEHARGCERVVLIGSDAPELTQEAISGAFDALARHGLTVGPACDGGFYLLGAAREVPEALFRGVTWSGPQVLRQTLANAETLGLSCHLRAPLHDIDEFADLRALRERLRGSPLTLHTRAPHTRAALGEFEALLEGGE